jgi:pantoate--beta-alanine ligase
VEIVTTPFVREPDGLACSARNRELTATQRQEALVIFQALEKVRQMAAAGTRSADRLVAEATHILSQRRRVRIIYIALVDSNTMETLREVNPGRCLLAIAVWVDEIRLTDNLDL